MMRQFWAAKKKYPDALLFFRMGDFYEMFGDDARVAAPKLGITLTSRSKEKDLPMAGVPVKSMEGYLVKLVRMGHSVAICEQLQDPRDCKGIVDRDVVRVVSPGTLIEDENLDTGRPLFVLAVHLEKPSGRQRAQLEADALPIGLAWADLSTGSFRCAATTLGGLGEELARIQPAEVLLPDLPEDHPLRAALDRVRAMVQRDQTPLTLRAPWAFDSARGRRDLCEQLRVQTLEAFAIEDQVEILAAGGGLLDFLRDTQRSALEQIRDLRLHQPSHHLVLDRATRRTLEITESQQDGGAQGTLLAVLDRSRTPMGARALRDWVLEPLVDIEAIRARHQAVAVLVEQAAMRRGLGAALEGMGDLERLAAKVATGRAGGRDLVALAAALERVPSLRELLRQGADQALDQQGADQAQEGRAPGLLAQVRHGLDPCATLAQRIRRTLQADPPLALSEGGLICDGFDAEVDELRALARGGKEYLAALQQREAERTGIPTLKLGFNRVFGYYIEVTRVHADAVPEDYIRKQTLKNAERYITPELKEYEAKVLGAEEKLHQREYQLFLELRAAAAERVERLVGCARAVARIDVLASLAEVAVQRRYVRPEMVAGEAVLEIREGRHPVVEATLIEEPFVPNDTCLGGEAAALAVLTGPNMSGKSTYLRQTALIVLLAQMGSFVPARSARIGQVDRIFTRLGGGDDISRGASTFMVEMVETAHILRHASRQSLLLLDEVGRGTSTFDGLAIAWAVCEHVHDHVGARCLFATHYHQLTDLAADLDGARNLNVAVREWGDEIVFLHRIDEGGTDRSYGIHVGRLAGLPQGVLERARQVLERLEREEEGLSRRVLAEHSEARRDPGGEAPVVQNSLFDLFSSRGEEDLVTRLRELDLDSLPPIEAWQVLSQVKRALE